MATAIRECKEEIGLDLASGDFITLGSLEHRNISIAGKLAMVLIPYGKRLEGPFLKKKTHPKSVVFLQVTPSTPKLAVQTSEVADAQCKIQ